MATIIKPESSRFKKIFLGGLTIILLLVVLISLSPFTIIQAGHKGVVIRLGDVSDTILPEGFHFINPIDEVVQMSVQTERYEASSSAASKDLQSVNTTIVLNHYCPKKVLEKLELGAVVAA